MRDASPGCTRPSPDVVDVIPKQVQTDPFASTHQMVAGPPIVAERRFLLGATCYAATRKSVALAKNWARAIFAGEVDESTLYDLSLCADELVDNGRKHGHKDGVITVAAYLTDTVALLEVGNAGSGTTAPHVAAGEAPEEGRGLMIVAAVSARCGSYLNRDRTQIVWCEFPRKAVRSRPEGNQ